MRLGSGIPESGTVRRGGGLVGRRAAWSMLLTACVACPAGTAAAQQPWWNLGWAFGGNPTANWSAENLADYMYTGQTPHPSVARIVAPESGGASLGSGVLVDVNDRQGLVLTNWHVVRDSRSAVLVQFPDGFQSAGTVVRWDEAWDLAAVVVWKPGATPVPIASEPPRVGEQLTIAGFGRGVYREQSGECTEYLSPGTGYPKEFVELRAKARQGDSGGPILNERRELAGVLFGQNDGRTIGSCSTRVREFLAAVGSKGYEPPPVAEFAEARAVDPGAGAEAGRIAARAVSEVVPRSTYVPDPAAVVVVAQATPGPTTAAAPPGWPAPPVVRQPSPLAGLGLPSWLPDPWEHRSTLLAGAGGLALVVLGVRTAFGGRRAA